MMPLFDDEEIWKAHNRSMERKMERKTEERIQKIAVHMLKSGKMSLEEISEYVELPLEKIRELNEECVKEQV